MHNIRKIKRKKKTKFISPQETPQDKLIEISHFQNQEDQVSDVDLFIEKLKPKNFSPQVKKEPKGRIFQQQNHLSQFINDFQRKNKGKVDPHFISFNELRCRSTSLQQKKPISIINYMLIDKRQKKQPCDIRNKFSSLIRIKRKFSPRKHKSQESQNSTDSWATCNSWKKKENALSMVKDSENSNSTPFSIKNVKYFTKYSNFYGK